jgi:thiamine transport system permease protein
MPSVVVASGLILAWGRAGFFSRALLSCGLSNPLSDIIYSQYAIVFANVLMNVPFCSGIIFKRLLEIPASQYKAASLLGLSPSQIFKNLLWPVIMPVALRFAGLSFLLSMGSFGALSILGSGPQSETLELALYQAIYYDSDWILGGALSVIHTLICGSFALLMIRSHSISPFKMAAHSDLSFQFSFMRRTFQQHRFLAVAMASFSVLLDFLTLSPLAAVVTEALSFTWHKTTNERSLGIESAAITSLGFAIPAAILTTIATWVIVRAYCRYLCEKRQTAAMGLQLLALSSLIVPPMAVAFGIMVLQSKSDLSISQVSMIAPALAAITLPFAMSVLLPTYESRLASTNQSRLILGLPETIFIKKVEWKTLRTPLAIVFSVSAALCLNETSLVTMLGDPTTPALTTTMIRLMSQYRFNESAVIACILIFATISIVYYFYKSEGLDHA